MPIDSRAALPPGPEYAYGGAHLRFEPTPDSLTSWRVVDGDRYLGTIATAEPVKGEPEVHFAVHFPGEEDIPPIKITPLWTSAAEFLVDAADPPE